MCIYIYILYIRILYIYIIYIKWIVNMQPVSFSEKEHRPEIHGSWRIIPVCVW